MDYPPVKMVQFSGDALTQGIEVVQAEQVALRVYGVAKTVADLQPTLPNSDRLLALSSSAMQGQGGFKGHSMLSTQIRVTVPDGSQCSAKQVDTNLPVRSR